MDKVEKFKEMAIKSFEAEELGEARKSDRCRIAIRKIAIELYKNDEIEKLKPLMYSEHDAVRFEAASKLLPFYT